MGKMWGKIVTLFGVMLLVFSGCAGKAENDALAAEPTEKIILTFWDVQPEENEEYDESLRRLIEQYGKLHPEVEVELQRISQDHAYEAFLAASIRGATPDLCSCPMAQPAYFHALGQTLDLSPIVKQWQREGNTILEQLDEDFLEIYRYDGELTALAYALDCRVLYYREDLLQEAGVQMPLYTAEEFESAFAAILDAGIEATPFLFSANSTTSATAAATFFLSMNGAKSETNIIDTVITDRNAISSYRILERWLQNGYLSRQPLELSDEDVRKSFLAGEACMILTQPIASWLEQSDLYDVCGVAHTPAGPYAIRGYTYYSPFCYQAFSSTEHPDEVLDLIRWLMENNAPLFEDGKSCVLPIRSDYQAALKERDENLAEIFDMVEKHGRMSNYPHNTIYPFQYVLQGEGILSASLTDILGGADVLEALSKAELAYRQILENYGY